MAVWLAARHAPFMIAFLVALVVFILAHVLPTRPTVRVWLVDRVGRRAYLASYSAVSLVLLGWVVVAARRADTVELWEPALWQWWFAALVMPVAFVLLVAGLAEPNPLSVSIVAGDEPGPITAVTRHPVLWGFLLWALAHIPANGRLVPIILFGTMAALAAGGVLLLDRKARRRLGGERWQSLAAPTSNVPFAALAAGRIRMNWTGRLVAECAIALLAYAWMLVQGHALLIGPDPLGGLRALS